MPNTPYPVVLNGLSFDIEDWFQVENLKEAISRDRWESCELRVVQNTRKILAILERCGTRATFFILGWVAERCPALVREIAASGHDCESRLRPRACL
jgi:peptidoglycan/xylan/chitin deacetylase (PgdA/CDA1 family)